MLTPRFKLSQTDNDITITINAPYANIAETEIFVAEEHFRFFSPPYYLRLHLPGSVEETDASTGRYESDAGQFIITVGKVIKGEHFADLDLLTSLLAPRKDKPVIGKAGIEVISASAESVDDVVSEDADSAESDWFIEQTLEEPTSSLLITAVTYGFANQCSGVFGNFKYEFNEIVDLPAPDSTPASDRPRLQLEAESDQFSDDHYLEDFMEDTIVKHLLQFQPSFRLEVDWTAEEQDILKELPNREYLLSKSEREMVYFGLADILFAFCYNHRANEGENNSESAWLINKLSATLSWLQTFPSLAAALKSSVRRSLVYPLFRNFELAIAVVDDVETLFKAGKKAVLKCLLEIYSLFNLSEPRYLLNQLYIKDYCVWVQQCSEHRLIALGNNFTKAHPSKADLDLDLLELEAAAKLVQEEENLLEVSKTLSGLQLTPSTAVTAHTKTTSSTESESSEDSDSDSTLDSDESVEET